MAKKRPWLAQRMCREKKRHASDIAAMHAAQTASGHFKTPFNPYRCPFCDYWHIGRERKGTREKK